MIILTTDCLLFLQGLLVLAPEGMCSKDNVPEVFLRPSQRKIQYASLVPSNPLDVQRNILDVLKPSSTKSARASGLALIYLRANGVPEETIIQLFEEELEQREPRETITRRLTRWLIMA